MRKQWIKKHLIWFCASMTLYQVATERVSPSLKLNPILKWIPLMRKCTGNSKCLKKQKWRIMPRFKREKLQKRGSILISKEIKCRLFQAQTMKLSQQQVCLRLKIKVVHLQTINWRIMLKKTIIWIHSRKCLLNRKWKESQKKLQRKACS